jgi:hypothetical protein
MSGTLCSCEPSITRGFARALVVAWLAAAPQAALAAPPAQTSPAARADEPFQTGVRRYQEGDLQGAAAAFALAYEQSHDFRLLYNLAQVQEDLQDHAQALRSLELYLARGGEQIAAERREEVARTQADLERRSASVRVTTTVAGARLWVDGVPAGSLPSEPTWLNPGVHHLLIARDGHASTLQTIVLLPGERRLLEVPLGVAPGVTPKVAPQPAAPSPRGAGASEPSERMPLWIGMGAAGASAALAVGFALLTRNADARLERELSHYPADGEALDAARSRVATLAAATDVCIGASVIAAGASLYFALASAPRDERRGGDGVALGNVRLELAPGSSSVAFESTF